MVGVVKGQVNAAASEHGQRAAERDPL